MKKNQIKKHLKTAIKEIASALIAVLIIFAIVKAAPPLSPYTPGETLDPSCSSIDDENCTVTTPAISGANSDITALSGLTTALSVGQGGSGLSTIASDKLLYTSALDTLSALSLDSTLGISSGVLSVQNNSITGAKMGGDALDWSHFDDAMTLDATTTIDMTAGDLNFHSGTLYIDNAGYVGIGTTTPRASLDAPEIITSTLTLSPGATLSSLYGFNPFLNITAGIGINNTTFAKTSTMINPQINLANIGTIQAGETHLRSGGTFADKVDYTTGEYPNSVAIGDLDGDGKNDIATANISDDSVSVFINDGDGIFADKVDYTTGTEPFFVAIGDLNGDGKNDLAVANSGSDSVSVLINNGDGTFADKVDYTTGEYPNSVAIGDLDGDGKNDLAVANYDSDSVSVLINNGDGTFAAKVDYTAGTRPASVAIGDLDGDGKNDIAAANVGDDSVSVFINNGDGTFADTVGYPVWLTPFSVAIGDLDGDGKNDLAVANSSSNIFFVFTVSIFINNGDGTFADRVDYGTESPPSSVAIGDLNGDGKNDLATANYGSDSVSVLINNPTTMFFADASTSNVGIGVTDPDEKLEVAGHYKASGTAPGLSACGTTPTIAGADSAGKITIGTGETTSCTVTFAAAFAQAPACTVSGDNTAVGYAATTTTEVLTITSSADMASDVISYICFGNSS